MPVCFRKQFNLPCWNEHVILFLCIVITRSINLEWKGEAVEKRVVKGPESGGLVSHSSSATESQRWWLPSELYFC